MSVTNIFDLLEPELLNLWDFNKNHKNPNEYTNRNSKDKIYWTCGKCNSSITKSIAAMVDTNGFCKKCRCYNK